jgi:hypothetical protein
MHMSARLPFLFSAVIAAVVLFAAIKTVFSQPAPQPSPPMVIEAADADAFREIIETTIPPRYNGALIRWYSAILQRQQAKATADIKASEKPMDKSQ